MSNLFQVDLLTPEEVGSDVKLPETPKEEVKETKPEEKKKEEVKEETPKIDILTPEEVDAEVEENEETGEKTFKQNTPEDNKEVALDYKTLAESRIKSGVWEEYENWEELKDQVEWTPELFEKLETEQVQNRIQKAIEEEKSQYGVQYKQLLEHAQNGGNVQDLLPSIQQEINLESLDENSLDDAEELVRAECEAKGWSPKRISTYLDSLKDQGEDTLKETAKEAKTSLKTILDEERAEIIESQKAQQKAYKEYWEGFNKKIRESIFKDEELSTKEQKDLEKFAFDYKHVDDKSGSRYSDFNLKFEEIKKDPAKYAKLIKIVKNFDEVVKKETAKKEATKEISFLLRGAQTSLGKNKSSESPELVKNKSQKGQWNPFQFGK